MMQADQARTQQAFCIYIDNVNIGHTPRGGKYMVISFCCGKGGTGKTTSTYKIGAALAKAGKRVLICRSS